MATTGGGEGDRGCGNGFSLVDGAAVNGHRPCGQAERAVKVNPAGVADLAQREAGERVQSRGGRAIEQEVGGEAVQAQGCRKTG